MHRLHVFTIVLEWGASLPRLVIPLGVVFLQVREYGGAYVTIAGAVILALTALWSVASYLTTRYGLTNDALLVVSGVLRKQSRVIPFSRIQSVNVRQTLLQRVFGCAELRVETATQGAEAEAVLSVLRWREAQHLREHLVAERQIAIPDHSRAGAAASGETHHQDAARDSSVRSEPATRLVAAIEVEELMVAGGTSNNIGVLIALLVSGCERFGSSLFDDFTLPGNVGSPFEAFAAAMGNVWLLALLFLIVVVPILFASWLVSVAGSVVRYYGFTLERSGQDLRRRHGLFSRVEASVPIACAQAIRFRQSILRRPFRRGELLLVSAGSVAKGDGASGGLQHLMPIVHTDAVSELVGEVFPDADLTASLTERSGWQRAATVSWLRIAFMSTLRWSVVVLAIAAWRGSSWLVLAWFMPLLWLLAGIRWRARGIISVPGYLLVREGGLSRTTIIMPERKLQLIEVMQGPLQRLFGVATLHLTTAGSGGSARMVDLRLADARSLRDALLARLPAAVRRPASNAAHSAQTAQWPTVSVTGASPHGA